MGARLRAGPTPAFEGREATAPPEPKATPRERIVEPMAVRRQTPRLSTSQHEIVAPTWLRIELRRARAAFKGERRPAGSASSSQRRGVSLDAAAGDGIKVCFICNGASKAANARGPLTGDEATARPKDCQKG